jgi:hypothetical protein
MKRKHPHNFSVPIAAQNLADIEQRLDQLSDEQLEEIVGNDAIGQRLRAMTNEQLEAMSNPLVSGLGDVLR